LWGLIHSACYLQPAGGTHLKATHSNIYVVKLGLGSNTEGTIDPHRVDDLPIHTLRLWGGSPYLAADGPDLATNTELARDGKRRMKLEPQRKDEAGH
jgi:hypothetical protein